MASFVCASPRWSVAPHRFVPATRAAFSLLNPQLVPAPPRPSFAPASPPPARSQRRSPRPSRTLPQSQPNHRPPQTPRPPTSKGSSSPKISKKTTATISLVDPPSSRVDVPTRQRQRSAHPDAPESGAHRRPPARFVNNPTIRPAHRELHPWWRGLGWCQHSQARWQAVGPWPDQLIFG